MGENDVSTVCATILRSATRAVWHYSTAKPSLFPRFKAVRPVTVLAASYVHNICSSDLFLFEIKTFVSILCQLENSSISIWQIRYLGQDQQLDPLVKPLPRGFASADFMTVVMTCDVAHSRKLASCSRYSANSRVNLLLW